MRSVNGSLPRGRYALLTGRRSGSGRLHRDGL